MNMKTVAIGTLIFTAGCFVGAIGMKICLNKKVRETQEKLEAEYQSFKQDWISVVNAKEELNNEKNHQQGSEEETATNFADELDNAIRDQSTFYTEVANEIDRLRYATEEENWMNSPDEEYDRREDMYPSIEDARVIKMEEFAETSKDEVDKFVWYWDMTNGALSDDHDCEVEFYIGDALMKLFSDYEKNTGLTLGLGDSFFIESRGWNLMAEIVIAKMPAEIRGT